MATLHADEKGLILRWLNSAEAERDYPEPPEGTVTTVSFDPALNAELFARLCQSTDGYEVAATEVRLGKEIVPIVTGLDVRNPVRIKQDVVSIGAAIEAATTLAQLKTAIRPLVVAMGSTVDVVTEARKAGLGSAEDGSGAGRMIRRDG